MAEARNNPEGGHYPFIRLLEFDVCFMPVGYGSKVHRGKVVVYAQVLLCMQAEHVELRVRLARVMVA